MTAAKDPVSLWGLAPETYVAHPLHRHERAWGESNCYVDLWIELLHSMKLESYACLPFTLAVDFDGDQWAFAKPPLADLDALFGIEVSELNVWRPLLIHAQEQLALGRLILTEADAFFLPDTLGTDYRQKHTKTTIALESVSAHGERMGYFHNGGYFQVAGEDFRNVMRIGLPENPLVMPLYAELVKLEHLRRPANAELIAESTRLLALHLSRRPKTNPIPRFAARFAEDLPWLKTEPLATFHGYAFATVRQLGASYELAALYLRWLAPRRDLELGQAADDLDAISGTAKALILKMARAVSTKREADFGPMFAEMAARWDSAMARLDARRATWLA